MENHKYKILMEMRPALDGYAGIPQETRLLFRRLCEADSVEQLEGLLQTSHRYLPQDLPAGDPSVPASGLSHPYHRLARVVIAIAHKSRHEATHYPGSGDWTCHRTGER